MSFSLAFPDSPYRDVRGHVLRLPSGVIGVPIEHKGDGWWHVIVVGGTNERYPVGGHDIWISPNDVAQSQRISIDTL